MDEQINESKDKTTQQTEELKVKKKAVLMMKMQLLTKQLSGKNIRIILTTH